MLAIISKVRDTERRMQQYAGSMDNTFERTKEVARQALLYIISFLLVYSPIAGAMMAGSPRVVNFFFALLIKTLSCMQGFFNCIIFLRNQYRALTAQGESLYFLRRLSIAMRGNRLTACSEHSNTNRSHTENDQDPGGQPCPFVQGEGGVCPATQSSTSDDTENNTHNETPALHETASRQNIG